MEYEKLTQGTTEFCKIVQTSVKMETKAEVDKEMKNFLVKKATITEALDAEEATINTKLNVFK